MKKLLIYFAVMVLGNMMFSQQLPQSSMYMMNNYLLNPAEGGTEDFIDLQLGYRTQWTGLDDGNGPKTIYMSGHTPLGKHSITKDTTRVNSAQLDMAVKPMAYHGVGGMVLSDNAGHFTTLEVKGSYAYHLPIGKKFNLSLGAFLGFKQTSLDNAALVSDAQGGTDPTLGTDAKSTVINPDLTLGVWGYHKKYYFGISSFQLFANDVKLSNETTDSKLNRHYYFTGGYKIDINKKMFLVPSVLVKVLPGVPVTTDFNAKLNYNQKFWGGLSFRYGNEAESVVLLAGITLKNIIDIGYAYDVTLTSMNNVKNNGSHEIILGLRMPNHQHHAPPKQFW
jgi:type IX secretion system PorP/SprF family membrane protein